MKDSFLEKIKDECLRKYNDLVVEDVLDYGFASVVEDSTLESLNNLRNTSVENFFNKYSDHLYFKLNNFKKVLESVIVENNIELIFKEKTLVFIDEKNSNELKKLKCVGKNNLSELEDLLIDCLTYDFNMAKEFLIEDQLVKNKVLSKLTFIDILEENDASKDTIFYYDEKYGLLSSNFFARRGKEIKQDFIKGKVDFYDHSEYSSWLGELESNELFENLDNTLKEFREQEINVVKENLWNFEKSHGDDICIDNFRLVTQYNNEDLLDIYFTTEEKHDLEICLIVTPNINFNSLIRINDYGMLYVNSLLSHKDKHISPEIVDLSLIISYLKNKELKIDDESRLKNKLLETINGEKKDIVDLLNKIIKEFIKETNDNIKEKSLVSAKEIYNFNYLARAFESFKQYDLDTKGSTFEILCEDIKDCFAQNYNYLKDFDSNLYKKTEFSNLMEGLINCARFKNDKKEIDFREKTSKTIIINNGELMGLIKLYYPEYISRAEMFSLRLLSLNMPDSITLNKVGDDMHITMFNTGEIDSQKLLDYFMKMLKNPQNERESYWKEKILSEKMNSRNNIEKPFVRKNKV